MCVEGYGVSLAGAAVGADLGGSSKHSAETRHPEVEDRAG